MIAQVLAGASGGVSVVVDVGIVALTVGMALMLYRMVKGPHLADRAIAGDVLSLLVVGLVVLLAVDQPRPPALVRRVLEAHREQEALITYPTYHGRGGHPVVFSAALLPEMLRIRESRQGLREVVQRYRSEALRLEIDDQEALRDLNSPADYQRAMAEVECP